MTFGNIENNNNTNVNVAAVIETLTLKVSCGSEIRRTSLDSASSFNALSELVAKLFNIEQASILLKYQDEDNDMITMTTDEEFQYALKSAKEKQLLRLFAETKAPLPASPAEKAEKPSLVLPLGRFPCGPRIGHGPHTLQGPLALHGNPHAHHHHHHRHHHGPHHGNPPAIHQLSHGPHELHRHRHHHAHPHDGHAHHHAHPHDANAHHHHHHHHGPHGAHAHHHGPRGLGPQRGGPYGFHGPFGIRPADPSQPADLSQVETDPAPFSALPHYQGEANFSVPRVFAHGTFSPATEKQQQQEQESQPLSSSPSLSSEGPLLRKCELKREDRRAIREKITAMKANAITEEDKKLIREARQKMIAECRARWIERRAGMLERLEKKGQRGDKKREGRLMAQRVLDVTIPDDSELPADTPVTKTWRFKNVGTTEWPEDSQLIHNPRFGDALNGPERIKVGKVEKEGEIDVSVSFITPSTPGKYSAVYRMADGKGNKFGQRVWVSFRVPAAESIVQATEKLSLA